MPGAGGARVEQHAVLAVGHPWVVRAGHLATDDAVVGVEEFGVAVDWTEDVILMPGIGSRYKAVVFGSTSRDTMWKHGTAVNPTAAVNTTTGAHLDAAKTALRQYVRAGGGFVAIHNAVGGTECNWPYYEGLCGVTHNSNVRGATQFFEGLFDVRLSPGESFRYIFGRRGEYFFNDPFAARTTGKVEVY
jgi:hypothetical protein